MNDEIAILEARIQLLKSDNFLLERKICSKNKEIMLLNKIIRKLKLQIPRKITEVQLSLDEFV